MISLQKPAKSNAAGRWGVLVTFIVIFLTTLWWFGDSKTTLSDDGYDITLALYRVCNQRSVEGLQQIRQAVQTSRQAAVQSAGADPTLDAVEAVIDTASAGRWHEAATECRRLMDDQVKR